MVYHLPGRDPAASIFFHMADGNLENYLEFRRGPGSDEERWCTLSQMFEVSEGLKWPNQEQQHYQYLKSGKVQKPAYFHSDLKPDNILVFGNADQPETLRFKITDFGEACVPTSGRDTTAPGRTYAAPEGIGREKSDVWAYGCILLLLLIYNHEPGNNGSQAVKDFRVALSSKYKPIGEEGAGDYFHQRSKFTDSCNKAVTELINNLWQKKSNDLSPYCQLARDVARYLQSNIFKSQNSRDDIDVLCRKVHSIWKAKVLLRDIRPPLSKNRLKYVGFSRKPEKVCVSPKGRAVYYGPDSIRVFEDDKTSRCQFPLNGQGDGFISESSLLFKSRARGNNSIASAFGRDQDGAGWILGVSNSMA